VEGIGSQNQLVIFGSLRTTENLPNNCLENIPLNEGDEKSMNCKSTTLSFTLSYELRGKKSPPPFFFFGEHGGLL
jgi:hypothetical protein